MELHLRNVPPSGPLLATPQIVAPPAQPDVRAFCRWSRISHVRGHGFRYPTLAERKQVRTTNVIVSP